MSKQNQSTTFAETRFVSRTTVTMSPIFLSHNQALQQISLLSPEPTKNGQYHTLLTIDTYSCAPQNLMDASVGYDQGTGSPEDRDCYYDQDTFYSPGLSQKIDTSKLPPIPTYHESQIAYHPNGVKRLPHFHPQRFSKRLRTIISQRRRPEPLSIRIEPPVKSYFSPSPTPCKTASTTTTTHSASLIQSILRVLPQAYTQLHQVEQGTEEYNDEDVDFWRTVDHRVFIIGIVGLLILAFSLGAWVMALYTA